LGESGKATIELFDLTGRTILGLQRELRPGQQLPLELGGRFAPGTYVLRVTANGQRSEQRVMIK
ncbi:MAG TPA: T9SS type A sorting domain-containing protein, partial [Flavobacteriales bacterium]|nr:T9SS type A sorting domain-containing protein [Flavobacteriales bacterium]